MTNSDSRDQLGKRSCSGNKRTCVHSSWRANGPSHDAITQTNERCYMGDGVDDKHECPPTRSSKRLARKKSGPICPPRATSKAAEYYISVPCREEVRRSWAKIMQFFFPSRKQRKNHFRQNSESFSNPLRCLDTVKKANRLTETLKRYKNFHLVLLGK